MFPVRRGLAVALPWCLAAAAAACTIDTPGCLSTQEVDHFNLLNAKRAAGFTCPDDATFARNSNKLVFDCRLWAAARLHSRDMGESGYFSHASLDGRGHAERAEAQGVGASDYWAAGENIRAGSPSAGDALAKLLLSDGHCRNIGDPDWKVSLR